MRILLGICGSIAAYKSYDLARTLINEGHRVRVILTQGSLHFIRPEVFRYLGVESVYLPQEDFNFPHLNPNQDPGTVLQHLKKRAFLRALLEQLYRNLR